MDRIVLVYGIVGDHDGVYDWVHKEDYDKIEYSLGFHEAAWPGESYWVMEVLPHDAALREEE